MADDYFGSAVLDIDEWRDEPHRHRYVHGSFEGTDTRFSMYFVPEADYQGRFLHWLEGGPGGHEHEALSSVGFAASCGAYVIESNQGHVGVHPGPPDPTITGWRASEATARLAPRLRPSDVRLGTAPRLPVRRQWRRHANDPRTRERRGPLERRRPFRRRRRARAWAVAVARTLRRSPRTSCGFSVRRLRTRSMPSNRAAAATRSLTSMASNGPRYRRSSTPASSPAHSSNSSGPPSQRCCSP